MASLGEGQTLAITGGADWLAYHAIAFAKRRRLLVIADAKPEDADLVKGYGADIVVPRGTAFVQAIRREIPDGVDALLDTALLGA